jgi:hypothetical protein
MPIQRELLSFGSFKVMTFKKIASKLIATLALTVLATASLSQVNGNVPRAVPVSGITGTSPVVVTPTGTVFDLSLQPCAVGQALIWQATPLPAGYKCTTPTFAAQTEWVSANTAVDAGADKVGAISRSGRVNIGTTVQGNANILNVIGAPNNQVNIAPSNVWGLLLGNGDGTIASGYHGINHAAIINVPNQPLHLGSNNTSVAKVQNGGVGVGLPYATAPSTQVHIYAPAAGDTGLRLEQTKQGVTQATGIDTVAVGVDTTGKVRVTNATGSADTRAVDSQPQAYQAGSYNEFKQSASVGMASIMPTVGTYVGLQTFRKYGFNTDFSGGQVRQEATTDDGRVYYRMSTNATTWSAWKNATPESDLYRDGGKANMLMTGGGIVKFDNASNLSWNNRFIIIGGGASSTGAVYSTDGYYDIVMPPVGTVIPSLGNAAPVTVTAAGISMVQWGGLYYKLSGAGQPSVNGNFVYVGYGNGNYAVTSDMVLIAASNRDASTVRLGTGQTLDAGESFVPSAGGTQDRADAGLQGNAGARSGFWQTSAPAPAANWYSGAGSWQHLLDVRHSNNGNNYAMQFAGSFFDQWFYGRKTNNNPAAAWQIFLMQYANGDIPLKIVPRNYASVAAANADGTLPVNTIYTVTAGGGKALYIK